MSNPRTPNPANPSTLAPRYEIRQLTSAHTLWAAAIVTHSNAFHSPIWPVLYPEDMTATARSVFAALHYLVSHQIESGMSFGVFDTEYEFKRPESAAEGGKLYWNADDGSIGSEAMLAQMDFPLVSVALSYDAANPLDMDKMAGVMAALPHFPIVYHILEALDQRDPQTWKATGPREVLMRNATSTRHDYEGQKLMGGLARWLMREAALEGYRGVQIECLHDAVASVWSRAEPPFKGEVVCEVELGEWRNEKGELGFSPATGKATKCYVHLKPGA